MYRYSNGQISLADFKQPVGMKLKESNRWVKKAQTIPLAGDREALRRPIHKPERQCSQAAASGLGGLHHSGEVWFLR